MYLAMASIPGIFGFLTKLPSGLGKLCGGMPGFIMGCGAPWWLICMNGMWFKCVGGALYPFANRGDLSSRGISANLNKSRYINHEILT